MNTEYAPVSLELMDEYRKTLADCSSRSSDYSIGNIWGWAEHYGLEWRFDGGLCWIRQTSPVPVYWAPVGCLEQVADWKAFPEISPGSSFARVPEEICAIWRQTLADMMEVEESRGQWDYIYISNELAKLSGNRFHKKKNLLRQFQKLYDYEYLQLTEARVKDVIAMQEEWCRWRDCGSYDNLIAESDAISRVLKHWDDLPELTGGLIRVDGRPMAYTIGEGLSADTIVVHFEKACGKYKGSYQAINWLYANDQGLNFQYINREQDLDDEGLRQAKLSYNPVDFLRKCMVKFK